MAFNPYNDGDMDGVQNITEGGNVDQGYFDKPSKGNSLAPYLTTATTLLGVLGTSHDIDQANKALMENLGNQAESLEIKQGQKAQQLDDLDRILGDQLSASGLEAMKRESRLKAASAETGATGTSNQEAIMTAEMDKLHRDAVLLRTADVKKANTQSQMVADRLNFENTTESMLTGQQSALSAGLETASSALRGFNQGLLYLNASQKEQLFNTDTTGTRNT